MFRFGENVAYEVSVDSVLQFLEGRGKPFVSNKSFHMFRRFSNFAFSGIGNFFSNSQKINTLIPTLGTLPEKLDCNDPLINSKA